jgi:hypothetical protein
MERKLRFPVPSCETLLALQSPGDWRKDLIVWRPSRFISYRFTTLERIASSFISRNTNAVHAVESKIWMTLKLLRHINPLLGKDIETNNERTVIAMQQLPKCSTVLESFLGSGPPAAVEVLLGAALSMDPLRDYISRPLTGCVTGPPFSWGI